MMIFYIKQIKEDVYHELEVLDLFFDKESFLWTEHDSD